MIRKIFNFVLNGEEDSRSYMMTKRVGKNTFTHTPKGLSHDHIRPGIANRRKKKGQHVIGS